MAIRKLMGKYASLQLVDGRSLMAAIALMITGVIVAMMVEHYVTAGEADTALTRSRLWWEIVLNLQILSVGMIWFCHSDRISESEGPVRRLHITLCSMAILSALMPSILGAVSAANNWFEIRPVPSSFVGFFVFGVAFWLVTLLAQIVLSRAHGRFAGKRFRHRHLSFYSPAIALGLLALIDASRNGTLWLIMTPVLLYLQGALPYLLKAVRLRSLYPGEAMPDR